MKSSVSIFLILFCMSAQTQLTAQVHFYEAESSPVIHHLTGHADGDAWAANVGQDNFGLFIYGPYATYLGTGDKSVIFHTSIGSTASADVLTIDVWDATDKEYVTSRVVKSSEFAQANKYQDVVLDFNLDGREGHAIETRVLWLSTTNVKVDYILILNEGQYFYQAESSPVIYHGTGHADGDAWAATVGQDNSGHLIYGPYATYLGGGNKSVIFRTLIGPTVGTNVMTIDVWDATVEEYVSSRQVLDSEFTEEGVYQDVVLDFNLDGRESHAIETRIGWYDTTDVKVDYILIQDN